ncbi:hypothetical protein E4U43_007632 [Claviceps pusilla]|uniref:ATPase, vacuolar ER assembly factor, Vma12 n=1 Tax=Claviceps pusilla TaxID=123648 RepID=A0A9P7NE58_9HYPO|nr:hypothetical protein E4U43_007632 [Claviceps pusilla]
MTPAIVDGLQTVDVSTGAAALAEETSQTSEPPLRDPAVGNPISHGQILDLWKTLNTDHDHQASPSLELLLRGSRVYSPPPPPKPEPSEEYKALMARLRHEEAQRAYDRMVNPPSKVESFHDRFPTTAQAYSQVNRPVHAADLGDDDVTLQDVHRQVMLIINFMVSTLGVAGTLWVTSKWWSVPARIFLTMGGSIVVAIAEVAVYSGYMWRMEQGKQKQRATKEVKEVVNTWVVGLDEKDEKEDARTIVVPRKEDDLSDATVRRRVNAQK